jgi:hypothetical protein
MFRLCCIRKKFSACRKLVSSSTSDVSLSLVYYRQDSNSRIHCEDYFYLAIFTGLIARTFHTENSRIDLLSMDILCIRCHICRKSGLHGPHMRCSKCYLAHALFELLSCACAVRVAILCMRCSSCDPRMHCSRCKTAQCACAVRGAMLRAVDSPVCRSTWETAQSACAVRGARLRIVLTHLCAGRRGRMRNAHALFKVRGCAWATHLCAG